MKNKGFSLVELIVVIAIMAILVGVAVPVYSSYIEKSQISKDKQTVDEVAHALQVYYTANIASNPDGLAGYVVLTQKGTNSYGDDVGAAAMEAIFGANWATDLSLSYDGWTNDGLLNYVLSNAESAGLVADSTFLTTATPDGLMNAVTNLTDAATTVIKAYGNGGSGVADKLEDVVGTEFVEKLNATGVTPDDEEYETVVSNMLVGHFANIMSQGDPDEVANDQISGLALQYATMYAYCETIGDTTTMEKVDTYLASSTSLSQLSSDALSTFVQNNCEDEFVNGYTAYLVGEFDGEGNQISVGKGTSDISAALEILGAVSHISGSYSDAETLSDPKLFSSEKVSEQLNNYIGAIKAVAQMDEAAITALGQVEDDAVVIFISADGAISVVPNAVYEK